MIKAKLVVIEGNEGTGKSTQAKLVAEAIKARGLKCEVAREPGGTPLGEELRQIFKYKTDIKICSLAQLYMVSACRAQLMADVVRPLLNDDTYVVMDRFEMSTYVYQHYGSMLDFEVVRQAIAPTLCGLKPSNYITCLLDVPDYVRKARMADRAGAVDRFETEKVEYLTRIEAGYNAMKNGEHVLTCAVGVIDGNQSQEAVTNSILSCLNL